MQIADLQKTLENLNFSSVYMTLKFWMLYSAQSNPDGLMSTIEAQHIIIIMNLYFAMCLSTTKSIDSYHGNTPLSLLCRTGGYYIGACYM